jgi:hypothetical protein
MRPRSAAFGLFALVACGETTPPARRPADDLRPPCERLCDHLEICGAAPSGCRTGCERDERILREGLQSAHAACVAAALPKESCGLLSSGERRARIGLCWAATLEAFAKLDDGDNRRTVVRAVCAHRARCAEIAAETCEEALDDGLARSAQGKSLAVARPTLVAAVARCVEARPCDDPDPVAACGPAREEVVP